MDLNASNRDERLIAEGEPVPTSQYRVYSDNTGKAMFQPVDDIDTIKAHHKARVGSAEENPVEQRTKSLSTRGSIDYEGLLTNAKSKCKNPIKISFTKIFFEVQVPCTEAEKAQTGSSVKRQQICKECSGYAAPGQTTYIMGASGAGKTSLLNILTDRVALINKAKISGNILFNDCIPVNKETFSRYAAYVMQDDILFSHFTVHEALTFAARLKLKWSEEKQNQHIDDIIKDLGLYHVKDTRIGDIHNRTISSGDRKITSIAFELIPDPSLLMLDEPTSGLDSFKARRICKLLNELARNKGKTIVSTIHQPSSDAFYYFDRLILMADGYIVYQGDAGESMDYFKGLKFEVPRFANPADFFMKVLSVKYPKQADDEKKLAHLTAFYRMQLDKKISTEDKLIKIDPPAGWQDTAIKYKATIPEQTRQLLYRSMILARREPKLARAKLLQNIIICGFMLPVFWQLNKYDTMEDLLSMVGAIYFMSLQQVTLNFQPTVIVFQAEKPVYMRERSSGMYDIWIYATTKWIAEIPISLIVPFVFNSIMYFSIGFTDSFTEFFAVYFIMVFMVQSATAMGFFLSSIFNHETTAVAFAPIFNLPLNLLGGYMINLDSIKGQMPQSILSWMKIISPVRYGFSGIMHAQFPLDPEDDPFEFTQLSNPNNILKQFAMEDLSYGKSLLGLVCVAISFRIFTVLSLILQDIKFEVGEKRDTRNTEIDPATRQA